jgi:aminoglycoside 3-N-acetyltransferase
MTEDEAIAAWTNCLDALGVKNGDTVYLAVDMGNVPLPAQQITLSRQAMRESRERSCAFVLDQLLQRIGSKGTLFVPTFTYSCVKPGSVFIRELTPSEVGPFTEYVRTRPEAVRSLHPMFSVTGIGPVAAITLSNAGGAAFGVMSPFGRLKEFDTKFLSFGVRLTQSLTYVHHLEQCFGCNHRFNKVIEAVVVDAGQPVERKWLAYVRFLSIAAQSDLDPLEVILREEGALVELRADNDIHQAVRLVDVERVGYQMLAKNPWVFSTRPTAVYIDESVLADNPLSDDTVRLGLGLR